MDDKSIDVKTDSSSSDESTAGGSEHRSDVMGDSSDSTNSNAGTDASARSTSMADFVKQSLGQKKDGVKKDDTSAVEEDEADANKGEKSGSETELDENKEGDKVVDDNKEDVDGEEKSDKDEKESDEQKNPVPYERFQKVVGERQELEKKFKDAQPKAEHFDQISRFCHENSIASEDFTKAMEVQAMLSQGDVEGALQRLLPIVEQLQGMTGNKLPVDLQKKVDDATIDLDTAKELAKLRAGTKFGKANAEQNQRRQAENQQRQFLQQCEADSAVWEQTKLSSDPEYKPKAKDSDPNGKWEFVRDNYLAKLNQTNSKGEHVNTVRTSKDMTVLMERAYQEVDATWKNFNRTRRGATRKALPSNGSSTTSGSKTIEGAKTMAEAINIGLARR